MEESFLERFVNCVKRGALEESEYLRGNILPFKDENIEWVRFVDGTSQYLGQEGFQKNLLKGRKNEVKLINI